MQGKCVGNFVSIITDVFDSQRNVNTSVGELLDENKGGLEGSTRSTRSIRCTVKRDAVPTLPSPWFIKAT